VALGDPVGLLEGDWLGTPLRVLLGSTLGSVDGAALFTVGCLLGCEPEGALLGAELVRLGLLLGVELGSRLARVDGAELCSVGRSLRALG
jgi:hypothetical protein